MRRIKVYVASPYSAPTPEGRLENTRRAMAAGLELLRLDFSPYIPHLTYFLDELANEEGTPVDYETWMQLDDDWLVDCNCLLYLAPSPGADRELKRASLLGIPCFFSVDELVDWAKGARVAKFAARVRS